MNIYKLEEYTQSIWNKVNCNKKLTKKELEFLNYVNENLQESVYHILNNLDQ